MAGDLGGHQVFVSNFLNGTECGRIVSPDITLIGRRVVHEEHFGTIRYVGALPNSNGLWLGVDWDNPNRGRHDGSYKGQKYFHATSLSSGSFVRPDKVSLGTSLEEALVFRYVLCAECQLLGRTATPITNASAHGSQQDSVFHATGTPGLLTARLGSDTDHDELEYSGSCNGITSPILVELFTRPSPSHSQTGATAVSRHSRCGPQGAQSILAHLQSAAFTLVPIYRALKGPPVNETAPLWPGTGGTLGMLLPSLTQLDLNGCMLSRWIDVAEICIQLPSLKSLNLSNNHLRLPVFGDRNISEICDATEMQNLRLKFDLDVDQSTAEQLSKAFPSLTQLLLVCCPLLDWSSLSRILLWMPSLRSLTVAYNKLGNVPPDLPVDVASILRQLIELDLTHTGMTDLRQLFHIIGPSSVLDCLLLNRNAISSFPELPVATNQLDCVHRDAGPCPYTPSSWFCHLTTLGIKETQFADWSVVSQLLHLPKLNHLLFLDCPVLENFDAQTGRQELIARLPHLPMLNRIEISADERRGAELDYLKRYCTLWRSTGGMYLDDHEAIGMSPEFAKAHPTFSFLCKKLGAPEDGESKKFTHAIKEGLVSISFVLQPTGLSGGLEQPISNGSNPPTAQPIVRRIHGRMTVGHLRMMVRRLFKLRANASFHLVAQGERHRKINSEILLESDTREIGFYCLEDGDTVFIRLHHS